MDKNRGIGKNGELLYNCKEDMQHFVELTKERGIVLMGRKTFESIGKVEGLKGRKNWIITSNPDKYRTIYPSENLTFFSSRDDVLSYIKDSDDHEISHKICIIGGATIYEQFLDYAEELSITRFNAVKDADAYFPSLQRRRYWRPISRKHINSDPEADIIYYTRLY